MIKTWPSKRSYCFLMDQQAAKQHLSPSPCSCAYRAAADGWPWGHELLGYLSPTAGTAQQRAAPWTSIPRIVSASAEICSLNCWCVFKYLFASLVDFIYWWSLFIGRASSGVGLQRGQKKKVRGSSSHSERFFSLVYGAQRPMWVFLRISGSFGSGPRCIIIPWQNKDTYSFLWVKTILSLQWKAEIWTQLLFCSVQWITSDS